MQNIESPNNIEKTYLACIAYNDTEENIWYLFDNRQDIYEWLCQLLQTREIDPYASFLLVDGVKLEDRKSVYVFMKYCEDIYNDGFDIDDFLDTYYKNNKEEVSNDNANTLSMSDLMKESQSVSSYQDIKYE